jgi:puromycin-sensitive aminopeptidase
MCGLDIIIFQAKFKLTLEVPSELVALSNMPAVKETVNGPLKTIYYEESPLMSTYLVAIVVGLFDYIESSTLQGTISSFMTFNLAFSFGVL